MSNHTPGPWLALPTVAPRGWNIEARGCTYTVAIARDGTGAPENEANARLIAAAPELLEALTRLRDCYSSSHSPSTRQSCWDQAIAAISKATGEQP
jgi:hypothetical protein